MQTSYIQTSECNSYLHAYVHTHTHTNTYTYTQTCMQASYTQTNTCNSLNVDYVSIFRRVGSATSSTASRWFSALVFLSFHESARERDRESERNMQNDSTSDSARHTAIQRERAKARTNEGQCNGDRERRRAGGRGSK